MGTDGEPHPGTPHPGPTASACRLVVAEDDVLLREGLASLLERAGFEVVGLPATGRAFSTSGMIEVIEYNPRSGADLDRDIPGRRWLGARAALEREEIVRAHR